MMTSCKISFTGAAMDAIKQRASAKDVPYSSAAAELLLAGVAAAVAPTVPAAPVVPQLSAGLDTYTTGALLDEVRRRAERGVSVDDWRAAADRAEAAETRADLAEARLAAIGRAMAGETA